MVIYGDMSSPVLSSNRRACAKQAFVLLFLTTGLLSPYNTLAMDLVAAPL